MKTRTMRGDFIDMGVLMDKGEKQVALGNAKMNSRGDILGKDGKIVKTRESLSAEYYATNPNAVKVKQVSLRDLTNDSFLTPAQALENLKASKPKRKIEDKS